MHVNVTACSVYIDDADNLAALDVVVAGVTRKQLAHQLEVAGLGSLTADGAVALDPAALHALAKRLATMPDWQQRWEAMLTYADRNGWRTADGAVLAHLVDPELRTVNRP